ncbi:MAG: lysylphosphatidylglycerol synthase transmembrane domain-containing protein [Verrucomicrobiota bacterium]
MKKKLFMIAQVLVSVFILAYLFNSIFEREASEELKPIATEPATSITDLATKLKLPEATIAMLRTRCVGADGTFSLKQLTLGERAPVVWRVGPRGLWDVFQHVSAGWLVLAVLCIGFVCLLGISRWRLILGVQGLNLSFSRTASIFFIGTFFNAFMLGSTGGDVIKAWYVAHETHHKKAEAIITVVVDRLIGLIALFIIALIMMGIFYQRVFEDKRLIGFSILTLVVVLGTVTVTILGFWKGFADKFPRVRSSLEKLPKYEMLERMVNSYRTYASHPVVILKTMLQSFGVHTCVMLSIVCVANGLHITSATLTDYFLYLPIVNSISAMPVSFSGFGVREGMYVEMFGQVGMPAVQALTLSLLGYIVQLVWSIVGGFFFLTHRKEVTALEQENAEKK